MRYFTMKCCRTCFKTNCRCNIAYPHGYVSDWNYIDIDYYIYPAIYEFNRKGYKTSKCCSGTSSTDTLDTFIQFESDIDFEFDSEYFQFDKYNYNGIHIRRNKILPKKDIIKLFQKKRTNKTDLLLKLNEDLYRIAKNAPSKDNNPLITELKISSEYYINESKSQIKFDCQYPWIIILPAKGNCSSFINDFFVCTKGETESHEIIVNNSGNKIRTKKVSNEDIFFNANSNHNILLFGYDIGMQVESFYIDGRLWNLSYVVLNADYYEKGVSYPIGLTEDFSDYLLDNPSDDLISIFGNIFSKLENKGIFICSFSSGQNLIVFSDSLDFAFDSNTNGSSAMFGPVDFDKSDFKHFSVNKKECFVFINGRLLIRRELSDYVKCNE